MNLFIRAGQYCFGPFFTKEISFPIQQDKKCTQKWTEKGPEIFVLFFNAIELPPRSVCLSEVCFEQASVNLPVERRTLWLHGGITIVSFSKFRVQGTVDFIYELDLINRDWEEGQGGRQADRCGSLLRPIAVFIFAGGLHGRE